MSEINYQALRKSTEMTSKMKNELKICGTTLLVIQTRHYP